ncbi:MAG TPA: DUF2325 domain-containing protein [Methylomusa anaerophila]|uniref:Dihydroorotate dehydrogenase n=1 Tax=Methylomusa anaerophila TaxID=1930071 RepID=A0A348AQQ3_9FIRM|nr:DUF2325 domain-containing protein [Methylomusa anaerophila]BBB93401.1 hypothetical protein MAMMFC1_04118 [Methylomusa anaerophila]HML90349.1 DUF2325 domain-containing protein [Methylomusa anaerophila]
MMVMVIGADYLGTIEEKLRELGVTEITHVDGRNPGKIKRLNIPKAAKFILVFTDYVNHNMAKVIKNQAKAQEIPLVYAKRSWCALEKKLAEFGFKAS